MGCLIDEREEREREIGLGDEPTCTRKGPGHTGSSPGPNIFNKKKNIWTTRDSGGMLPRG